jgi:hypothetical protein
MPDEKVLMGPKTNVDFNLDELLPLTNSTLIGVLQDLSDVRAYQGRKLTEAIRARISIALDQAHSLGFRAAMLQMQKDLENEIPSVDPHL